MNTIAKRFAGAALFGIVAFSPVIATADTTSAVTTTQQSASVEQLFQKGATLIKQNKLGQGINLLRQAATQGHPMAAFELASLHEMGVGVKKDFQQAKAYYEIATKNGHRNAHFNLALLLTNETAPFSDLVEARKVMQVIAQRGDVEAQYVLATLYKSTINGTASEPKQAIHWLQSASKNNHGKSQFLLGIHYLKGDNIARNPKLAFDLLNKSARQGVDGAQFNLALMYERGDGIAVDNAAAIRWYQAAANGGNANAQQNLGIKYLLGEQIAADTTKAMNLITAAANSGLKNAQFLLGQLYQSGYEGRIATNLSKAELWYSNAAKQGQTEAQFQLALILKQKKNGQNDAKFWIQQAAAAGHNEARKLQAGL